MVRLTLALVVAVMAVMLVVQRVMFAAIQPAWAAYFGWVALYDVVILVVGLAVFRLWDRYGGRP